MPRSLCLLSILVCTLFGLGGCAAPRGQTNHLQRATDASSTPAARLRAIRLLDDSEVFELFTLVTHARHPIAVRTAAVDRMLAVDPERFWRSAEQRAAWIDDWPMIRLLSERAASRQEYGALLWLVRSWSAASITVADTDRPERQAIEAITNPPAEALLRQAMFEPEDSEDLRARAAAWTVLMRVWGPDRLSAAIDSADMDRTDQLLLALQRCSRAQIQLPADREEVARLLSMSERHGLESNVWRHWAQAHRTDPRGSFVLRHIPAVTVTHDARRAWNRRRWLGEIQKSLDGRQHFNRGAHAEGERVTSRPERFSDHEDRLSIGDCIVLDALIRVLADRETVEALFKQADADLLDKSTEFGGVLVLDEDARAVARPFAPLLKQHDQVYVASDACIRAMHIGLAHYHFHAQRHDNAVWARPGKGDLDFSDRMHANGLVFTFIDRNTLNADAYFPGGIIVDLGCVKR